MLQFKDTDFQYPSTFIWGAATSAYQIEGAYQADGRGPSIWDSFSHLPGKVLNGDTGDIACDHYHRFPEDIELMKTLGIQAYRFSISWSRVQADGEGAWNEKGWAFYDRLINALLEAGIEPWITCFHWDLPQALQDKYGGWLGRETALTFATYCGEIAKRFSDRVKHFFTINEFVCFIEAGYARGDKPGHFAPGLKLEPQALALARHNALLAHGLGVRAIREHAQGPVQVGLADNPIPYVPAIETTEHITAARKAFHADRQNCAYLPTIFTGAYSEAYQRNCGADLSVFDVEDFAIIQSPVDFLALNVYSAQHVIAAASDKGYEIIKSPKAYPCMDLPWLRFEPDAIYWAIRFAVEAWQPQSIFISENGCATADEVDERGAVQDTDRVLYLRHYLRSLQRVMNEGAPVKGYFTWSLLDNFEWAEGYQKRFGLHYVDFQTQQRTAKLSAHFYRELISSSKS